ncbi:chromosome partitioning protein [Streptomyces canus]|uniref:ParA family protein n=1 Tax=Streptomyces canus TaxID=58343 RepID=UPI00278875BA|nr:ParA family protein [Streptomyces canus]MDQ0605508.1 chromosome partitioning protein [Streptomyces canus]
MDAVANYSEKGGVGKTSNSAGMVAMAAEQGLNVLAIDFDPRATLTAELGVKDPRFTLNDLLYIDPEADTPPGDPAEFIHDAIVRAGEGWPSNVWVLPSERPLGRRESDSAMFETRVRRALQGLEGEIDLAVMDVPPRAGGKLATCALIAAKKVFIPATLTTDGQLGAEQALKTIQFVSSPGSGMNEDLVLAGLVRSILPKKDDMRAVNHFVNERLVETFGDAVIDDLTIEQAGHYSGIVSYSVREECRLACVPITAAPGREAKKLQGWYGELLDHAITRKGA